jgi:predicted nuclease with TOPRIM domain
MSSVAVQSDFQNASHSEDAQAAAFQALEQRVLRAIELLRTEREQRAAAEQRAKAAEAHFVELEMRIEEQANRVAEQTAQSQGMDARLAESGEHIKRLEGELSQLNGERDQVRERVERLLQHLDEFSAA